MKFKILLFVCCLLSVFVTKAQPPARTNMAFASPLYEYQHYVQSDSGYVFGPKRDTAELHPVKMMIMPHLDGLLYFWDLHKWIAVTQSMINNVNNTTIDSTIQANITLHNNQVAIGTGNPALTSTADLQMNKLTRQLFFNQTSGGANFNGSGSFSWTYLNLAGELFQTSDMTVRFLGGNSSNGYIFNQPSTPNTAIHKIVFDQPSLATYWINGNGDIGGYIQRPSLNSGEFRYVAGKTINNISMATSGYHTWYTQNPDLSLVKQMELDSDGVFKLYKIGSVIGPKILYYDDVSKQVTYSPGPGIVPNNLVAFGTGTPALQSYPTVYGANGAFHIDNGWGLYLYNLNSGGSVNIFAPVNAGYSRSINIDQPNLRINIKNGNTDGTGVGIARATLNNSPQGIVYVGATADPSANPLAGYLTFRVYTTSTAFYDHSQMDGGGFHLFTGVYTMPYSAAGTTGNQTINASSGKVLFAASATSLTVTNSLVTANSIVQVQVQGTDASKSTAVSVSAGSFVITLSSGFSATTPVTFVVLNQ